MSPAEIVAGFLQRSEIDHRRVDERTFVAALKGEHRLQVPVTVRITDDAVAFESFFMRKPQENEAAFYAMCLRRNARAPGIAYAIDDTGDVYLVGRLPVNGVSALTLDSTFGALLGESDGMFNAAIETGFAMYLQADMAWRAAQATKNE